MKGRSSTPRGLDSRYSGSCDGAATPGDTRPRSPSLVRYMKPRRGAARRRRRRRRRQAGYRATGYRGREPLKYSTDDTT